jgi:hypothetical protein
MSEEKDSAAEEIPQEQPANKIPADETVSSAEPVAEAEQQETNNEQQETRNEQTKQDMEVHHHTHPAHGKKTWKSYFWEFLMLFLAVFCGFLAEYQLEHVIERQREKQYMQSFIYDLQNDTANLNYGFPLKVQRINAIDSVFLFFEENTDVMKIPGKVYRQMHRTSWDRHYRRNSTTIDQLKNAGGMRLIQKKNIADSIAAYDLQWIRAEFWRETYITNQEKGKGFVEKIINANDLLPKFRNNSTGTSLAARITDSLIISINPAFLNEYLNFLNWQKTTTTQDKRGYQTLEQSAERLITLIKKEYHLK